VDRATVESQLERFFADDPHGAAAVYLFGSVARGEARAGSDIDVGVLFAEDPPCTFAGLPFALEADLERLFARRVQVVVLNHAPADLVHRVLRDGRLVLDRDRSRRIRFEVAKRNEYFDLEPLLRRILWPRKPSPRGGAA
jgi:hypothetical protein